MLFSLQPKKAIVNDVNGDLILMYEVIRDKVDELITELETHPNDAEHFYDVRDWDRNKKQYEALSRIQKAARLIYLNKTCYNGLFRVNSSGEFNSPFGHYKNPNIVNAPALRAVSAFLQQADIAFFNCDYQEVLAGITKGTFVYMDPPYDPVSSSASFTGYAVGGFSREDQIRLRECCDDLTRRNVKFMLSNSATDFIREQYAEYNVTVVHAQRAINSVATGRGFVDEVVVRNYE